MGRPQGWGSQQTGRPIMQSPGRPGVNQQATFALASDGHPNVGSTHLTDLCPAIAYIALSSAPTPRHLPSCDASGSSPVADCGRRANHMLIVAL
jgi:hypothetical protein